MSAPDQDLREWLKIATDKLTPPARERIWSEIQAHYAEAVESHERDGVSELGARLAAMEELGDANVAAKRFQRQHLTEKETELIGRLLKSAHNPWSILFCAVCFVPLFYLTCHDKSYSYRDLTMGVFAAMCLFIPIIIYLVAKFSSAKHVVRRLLLLELVTVYTAPVFLICLIGFGPPHLWFIALSGLPACIKEIPRLIVWLKLRRIEDISVEMPHPDRIAS